MTSIKDARQALADALATSPTVPASIDLPATVIQGGDPYLSGDGANLLPGEWLLNLEVYLLEDPIDNAVMADNLDARLPVALDAIRAAGWGIDNIGQPQPWVTADWLAHGIQIRTSRYITLTD
jgi:hypothetical protein